MPTQQKMAYFRHFECFYLDNSKSDGNKPTHIWKVLNEELTLKSTAFKNMQLEANEVISKMADFALFRHKTANISRFVHPIMINHTIFFILKSCSFRWYHSIKWMRWWKNWCCKGLPFELLIYTHPHWFSSRIIILPWTTFGIFLYVILQWTRIPKIYTLHLF